MCSFFQLLFYISHDLRNCRTFRLAARLPQDKVLVSESGISNPDTIRLLREAGYRGFLIGETFMKTDAPGEALHQFIVHSA